MKQLLIMTSLFLSILLPGCSSMKGLTAEEKNEKEVALREAIENREFRIDVNRMIPMSGRSSSLTSNYSLDVNGDNVKSYLPYAGRAYSVPYGGGNGLIFESVIGEYVSSTENGGKTVIEFRTKTDEDLFVYRIEIFPNGSASINVRPNNRQSISFSGTAIPLKTK